MRLTGLSLALITFLFLYFAIDAFGGIRHSHHDFRGASWSNHEMCLPCHTPHHANIEVSNSPLWNHQLSTSTYTLYSSSTLNAFPGQPDGKSKLCFSCHDGTVAIENHSGITTGNHFATWGNVSTDLRDDHPISFLYDATLAQADGQLYDPATTLSGLGGTIEEDLLDNGRMECTSCHDVHISRNTQGCGGCHNMHGGGGMITKTLSLWKSNDGSALCLTCHQK